MSAAADNASPVIAMTAGRNGEEPDEGLRTSMSSPYRGDTTAPVVLDSPTNGALLTVTCRLLTVNEICCASQAGVA
ncbi:hypothetical protein Airi02_103890 [Actinoallomurus iriomotensis]|uniref:Uncharacterized protein n=1 Tax=Actinoallomurus iriomotensis TaxID=478107 RepID=A0A9W6SF75_9ACTN|nr:hypothetical protein Airi02_103890 [Actinoallomurus iriomotensis]